jgi:hypothetical protein
MTRVKIDDQLLDDVAAFYNERAQVDPSNPPSCRAIAGEFHFSASSAHKVRSILWAARRLCYPPRTDGRAS